MLGSRFNMDRSPIVIGALMTAMSTASAPATTLRAVRLDGTTIEGSWAGCPDGKRLSIDTGTKELHVAIDDLLYADFDSEPTPPSGQAVFELSDGGQLRGHLVGAAEEAIVVTTGLGEHKDLPFAALAGILLTDAAAYARAHELYISALDDRLPGKDVLITRSAGDPKAVRGALERLDPNSASFLFGGRSRELATDRIYGVVFAAGVGPSVRFPVTLRLTDGTVFSAQVLDSADKTLRVRASTGWEVSLPAGRIAHLESHSKRLIYVSDLDPVTESGDGLLHRPWPMRRDRSVSAGPMTLQGRRFEKGLGVHSRTDLVYQLDGDYQTLAGTVGIDDAVRPRGSVVFRVLGDGVLLWESGLVRGKDDPRDIVVDVSGVKMMTLQVDYGDELDWADHADWAGLRLIRPAGDAARNGTAP